MLGVRNDAELNELLKNVHISHGGVLPCIHPSLLKRKSLADSLIPTGRPGGMLHSISVANAATASSANTRNPGAVGTAATSSAAGITDSS